MFRSRCVIGFMFIVSLFTPRWVKGGNEILTTSFGSPVDDLANILTVGPRGPALLQDVVFLDAMAHFDRERIPERVVHAKGTGAFGYFEVTNDITQYTKADLFSEIGKKTSIAVRFSTVAGESGSADSSRDSRGFALKFYTDDGNWDLVGYNSPVFFIRDAMLFPSLVHALKRNPVTHLKDPDAFWDFSSLRPETTHQLVVNFADRGIPYGFRYMNGFGTNTFKLVNSENKAVYCKFNYPTNQGIRNLSSKTAAELAGSDPDYALRDLYNAIESGHQPSWNFSIQVMTFEQAMHWRYNPFDATKVWPENEFPQIEVGRFVLNRNPRNNFAEVEQMAFAPSNLVPGIEPSPDKLLQGRLFSYADTQLYRLGTNNQQIPVNCPFRVRVRNYQRDGAFVFDINQGIGPNYFPNSFGGPMTDPRGRSPPISVSGDIDRYDSADEDNFTQAGELYRNVLDDAEKSRLVRNIAESLYLAKGFIQERAIHNFAQADQDLGRRLSSEIEILKERNPPPIPTI